MIVGGQDHEIEIGATKMIEKRVGIVLNGEEQEQNYNYSSL